MPIKELSFIIASILGSLGLLAGGMGYLISKFKKGGKDQKAENTDLISSNDQIKQFYKEQNDDYKIIIKEQNDKITDITRQMGELKGQLTTVIKQNDEYKLIFQNRNPELEQFMKFMVQSTKDQVEVHTKIIKLLGDIYSFSKLEHDRDFKVEATVSKA